MAQVHAVASPVIRRPDACRRALEAILLGGAVAGVLDGIDAVVFYKVDAGVSPSRLFQHIASGLLGAGSFGAGWTTVGLGVLLHFTVATGAAAVFYAVSLAIPLLRRRPFLCGPVFGIGLFLFMQKVVVPLSAAYPKRTAPMAGLELADQLFSHMFFVGLPIALLVRRSARSL